MAGEPGSLVVRYVVESLPSSYFSLSLAATTLITVDGLIMSFPGGTVAQDLMPEKSQIFGFPRSRPSYHMRNSGRNLVAKKGRPWLRNCTICWQGRQPNRPLSDSLVRTPIESARQTVRPAGNSQANRSEHMNFETDLGCPIS